MRKLAYILILFVIAFAKSAGGAYAQSTSDASASVVIHAESEDFDFRVENLRTYLESHKSPLAMYAEDFVKAADESGIDYRLVPAIAGVESTFGKRIPKNSFNAYGWANGEYRFESWEDSIDHVTETLKEKYIEKGAGSIAKIARRYAPPSTTWGGNVKFFMKKIDSIPLEFSLEG